MPGQPIPSELKEKGLIWLLPPYCWSHRQIARKLKISGKRQRSTVLTLIYW